MSSIIGPASEHDLHQAEGGERNVGVKCDVEGQVQPNVKENRYLPSDDPSHRHSTIHH